MRGVKGYRLPPEVVVPDRGERYIYLVNAEDKAERRLLQNVVYQQNEIVLLELPELRN